MSTLPYNTARCPGVGSDDEGWREGCEKCLRRTAPADSPHQAPLIDPPLIIAFWCEYLIEENEL